MNINNSKGRGLAAYTMNTPPNVSNYATPINRVAFTYKVIIRCEKQRKDGMCPLYLQAFIANKRVRVSLGIYVLPKDFDKKSGKVKKSCPYAHDLNMMVQSYLSRANQINIDHRFNGSKLSPEDFKFFIVNYASKDSFLQFFEQQLKERIESKQIAPGTFKNHKKVLNLLKTINPDIAFHGLDLKFIKKFNLVLLNKKLRLNTRATYHRILNTYINIAIKERKLKENPYHEFGSVREIPGERTALEKDELNKLLSCYNLIKGTNPKFEKVLKPFLFACLTGLRVSDLYSITREHIIGDYLILMPEKTKSLEKMVKIPLSAVAKRIVGDNGELFDLISEQKSNEYLKEIAKLCGIRKNISWHVARHTFATQYLAAGGDVYTLKELMGHSSIKTTMVYVHISSKMKEDGIRKLDEVFSGQ